MPCWIVGVNLVVEAGAVLVNDKMRYKYRSHTSDWQELMMLDELQ